MPDVKVQVTTPDDMVIEEEPEPVAEKPVPVAEEQETEEPKGPENPIKLRVPVLINGVEREELAWTDEITVEQFLRADSLAHGQRAANAITEMDNGLHFWLGVMMIVAANPEIDPKDLEQIKGKDVMDVMRVGRFFVLPEVEEA